MLEKVLKMLPKTNVVLLFYRHQTKGNISAMRHKLQYNTGAAMQENSRQHWWYIISNTCNFAKIIHPYFFGEVAVRDRHHLDSEY